MAEPEPTLEDLQREKIMLEIAKLRQDMEINARRTEIELRREGWRVIIAAVAGGSAFLAAAFAAGKLFFG